MTEVQLGLLICSALCMGMGVFMHRQRALSRAGLGLVIMTTGVIAGFLYWAQ